MRRLEARSVFALHRPAVATQLQSWELLAPRPLLSLIHLQPSCWAARLAAPGLYRCLASSTVQYRSAAIAQQNGLSLSAFVLNFQRCHQSDRLSFSNYCFFFKVEPGKGRNEPLTPMQSVCVCVCGNAALKKILMSLWTSEIASAACCRAAAPLCSALRLPAHWLRC